MDMSPIFLHLQAHWHQQRQHSLILHTFLHPVLGLLLLVQRKLNIWLLLAAAAVHLVVAVLVVYLQVQDCLLLRVQPTQLQ
jgi:hypothetical protein